ncbi:MAG TPA: hypothetical protein VNW68_07610 [Candidatus Limnocylindria bacterium]|nr:hypothetical protein [Candidatus Limnocylindria bacterium]
MDFSRILNEARIEHRHGNDWHEMQPAESRHGEDAGDPERHWGHGRIYRCPGCDEEIRVAEPTDSR